MRSIRTRLEAACATLACGAVMALVAPLASLGCSHALSAPLPSAGTDDAHPRRGGTLHLASGNDITTLDPAGPGYGLSVQPLILLFDGLVDFDRQGQVIPVLAQSWEIEDSARTYRFHLRQGVQMHDGRELTAQDVKRSVERALHPTTPSLSSSFYAGIVGYGAYTQGKAEHLAGVTVLGRYDVVFQLSEPDPAFLSMMAVATMKPVCVSGGDRYVDTWMPCGAGPFKLEPGGWVRGTSLRLVRHDAYFRPGLPYLDAVEWQFGVTTMAQRFRFEQGELDLWLNPTGADPGRFAADARWKGLSVSLAQNIVWGEAMNTRMAPFDNIEVRRAVAAAINRNEAAMLQPANIAPMTQLLPRDTPGYEPDFPGQRYDEAAALEHMRKAGYPFDAATGKGGWPSPVVYTVTYPNFPSSWAEVLQQQLARIGIRLQLRLVTQNAYLAITQRAGSSAMHPQGDGTDYPDPSAFFEPLFTTAAIAPEGTSNTAYYSNPRYDDLVARARHEPDEAVRRALYHEANVLLCDEAPWAFSYGQHDYVMRQPYVRNFAMHPVWPFDVRDVWLDPPSATLPGPLGARPQ